MQCMQPRLGYLCTSWQLEECNNSIVQSVQEPAARQSVKELDLADIDHSTDIGRWARKCF